MVILLATLDLEMKILLVHTSPAKFLPELPGTGALGPTLIPCSVSDLSRQVTWLVYWALIGPGSDSMIMSHDPCLCFNYQGPGYNSGPGTAVVETHNSQLKKLISSQLLLSRMTSKIQYNKVLMLFIKCKISLDLVLWFIYSLIYFVGRGAHW